MLIPLQFNSCNIRYTKEDNKIKLNNFKLASGAVEGGLYWRLR